MKKLENLKEHICAWDNLYEAYRSARRGKTERAEVIRFEARLEENLLEIQRELMDGTYRVGKYREFYVRYPKPRLVMALGFKDRVVQWAIYRQIDPFIDKRFIRHSYGCRRGKGTLRAAEALLGWMRLTDRKPDREAYWIIKGDISKYFYRVDHRIVLDCYREICDEEWFLGLMDVIVNNPEVPFGLPEGMGIDDCPREARLYDVGQPIGNLTSQETANIYLDRFDQWCKHEMKLRYYVRYMDDFCCIVRGRKNAERILEEMGKFLREELKLELSRKSRIQRANECVEFVGYRITPQGIRMRKKTVRHVRSSVKRIQRMYAEGSIPYDRAMEAIRNYLGMTKRVNGYGLRMWIAENAVLRRE